MTAAAVARHPFRRVDLVDISSAVLMTLPLFERSNDGVARDRRVRLHLADGRRFLAGSPSGSYDLVTLEPPPPRAAGAAALYSREFYLAVRRVLTPGAALAQWLPLHGLTADELGLLTRTFLDVFPDGELVRISHQEAALLATRGPGATPEERAARAARPDVAEHLGELGVADPESLPRAGGEALRRALGPGPLVTDDHLRIEFFGSGLPGEGPAEGTARWRFLREIGLGPR